MQAATHVLELPVAKLRKIWPCNGHESPAEVFQLAGTNVFRIKGDFVYGLYVLGGVFRREVDRIQDAAGNTNILVHSTADQFPLDMTLEAKVEPAVIWPIRKKDQEASHTLVYKIRGVNVCFVKGDFDTGQKGICSLGYKVAGYYFRDTTFIIVRKEDGVVTNPQ